MLINRWIKSKFLSTFALTLCVFASYAQEKWIDTKASSIEEVDLIALPVLDNEILRDKYNFYDTGGESAPAIFAEAINTSINSTNTGSWESSINGHLLWRQRISSTGAYSINLGFTDFYLPNSAALFISDKERNFVIGPITQKDNDIHNQWWSPIIPSDEVVIELQINPEDISKLKLHLTKINHDFTGMGSVMSGSCNLDVVCGEDDGFAIVDRYRDLINSVGMMLINGSSQCTGVLVNNTRRDCTPYVMTAEHCGITNNNAASVIVYWNFQNSTCRVPNSQASGSNGNGQMNQFNSGSILRASYDQVDFALIEMDDPIDPELNPFFVGWDRETESVDTALTVHHPLGEEKRISFDYDQLTFGVLRNFVRVADWDIGTTERGSSGSPLFTKDKRLVGTLSAGEAACGNDLLDDFGMIKKGWEGGGSPETRVKDWLDPLNLGVTQIEGRFCTDVFVTDVSDVSICNTNNPTEVVQLTIVSGFGDGANVEAASMTEGLNVSFSSSTVSVNETIDIQITADDNFQGVEGSVTITLQATNGLSNLVIPVFVYKAPPSVATLLGPPDEREDLDFDVLFRWMGDAASYTLEFSTSEDFSENVMTEEDIKGTVISLRRFDAITTYYWRIRSFNTCGESLSSVFQFTTGEVVCQQIEATDVPIQIALQPSTITSIIAVNSEGSISDVNVIDVQGRHTWIRDLSFNITSPSGTQVVLVETPCAEEDDFFVSFDDASPNINLDCPLTTGRAFKPVEPLSAFNGEQAQGDWILAVVDGVSEDGGFLDGWTLELCINQPTSKSFVINPSTIEICDKTPGNIAFSLSLNGDWTDPTTPVVSTGSGIALASMSSPDPIGTAKEVTITIQDPALLLNESQVMISFMDGQDIVSTTIPVEHISDVISPVLLSPEDGAEHINPDAIFSWDSASLERISHLLEVSKAEDFAINDIEENIESTIFTTVTSLEELTTYFWRVTAIGTCADSTSNIFSFITDRKVATIDENLSGISVYPSPVSEYLTIDLKDVVDNQMKFEIVSANGIVVLQNRLNKKITEVDVNNLSPGLYFLNLISNRGTSPRKIVVYR